MIRKIDFEDAKRLYAFLSDCPQAETADFLLVLGCHDLRVPEHAAALYLSGAAPLILCTGGYGKMTEGTLPVPEGVLFAQRCRELGVPADAILVEDKATNTGENFTLSRALLTGKTSGIAVCKPYMAKRALAAGRKQWPEIHWSVSTPDIPFDSYVSEEAALVPEIELMVGDLQRLQVYADRGFQTPTPIPAEIWEVWHRLVKAGFDRYVLKHVEQNSLQKDLKIPDWKLRDLQPSQFWISAKKLQDVETWFDAGDLSGFPPIPVKLLEDRPVMTDGHTRAVAALRAGLEAVPLIWDEDELDWEMYRICVDACRDRRVFSPVDLMERIVTESEYRENWDGWCDAMHAEVEARRAAEKPITLEEIPLAEMQSFWDAHLRYLIDDGIIEDEEDVAYFSGAEYRGILEAHMTRETDRQHMAWFVRDNVRIGAASWCIFQNEDGKCFLMDFWVFPAYRGNGTGHRCFAALERDTKADGARYYELNSTKPASVRFWKSLGFVENGVDEYDMPLYSKR